MPRKKHLVAPTNRYFVVSLNQQYGVFATLFVITVARMSQITKEFEPRETLLHYLKTIKINLDLLIQRLHQLKHFNILLTNNGKDVAS